MALTLAESAKLTQQILQRGVVETFVQESAVLDRLPLIPIAGNSLAYTEELALPGIEFRAVNSAYAESTGTVNQKSESLVILGGDADVDTFLVKTGGNLADLRANQTRMKVKAASYGFQNAFVNGDVAVDANSFDGLKKRLTGNQVISAATNGLPVVGADSAARQTFLDKLDELIAQVAGGPDVLYTNRAIRSKIMSALRRENQFVESVGVKQEPAYQGIPLVDLGTTAAGVDIIPQTETQGSSSVASSIYAVKFGRGSADQAVSGLTNGGVSVRDLGELEVKPVYRTRIEFFCGLGIFGGQAAGRLKGVLNA